MRNITSVPNTLSSQKSRLGVVIPKDGGWGWVIVFASFGVNMISLGIIFGFEPLLAELSIYFKQSRYATAWVISIAFGISYCVGPIVSGLTNKYGCRKVTIAGALLMWFGMLVSIPAPSLLYLYLIFSPTVGTGLGMTFIPAVVIVNAYFENKRALAIGIALCGSGIGTLYVPHMIKFLISYYQSWQSALLILAGMMLNVVVLGALYRTPNIKVISIEVMQDDEQKIVVFEPIQEIPGLVSEWKQLFEERNLERTQSEPIIRTEFKKVPIRRAYSYSELENVEFREAITTSQTLISRSFFPLRSKKDFFDGSKITTVKMAYTIPSSGVVDSQPSRISQKTRNTVSGLLYRKDIFYSASLVTIPEYRDNAPEDYEALVTSLVEIEMGGKRVWYLMPREVWDGLKEMMDLSLLKNERCQITLLARFIGCFGVMTPYYYIVERANEVKIPNGTSLISIIGIANLFGRVGVGVIANHRAVNRLLLYKIWVIICGITIALVSASSSFITMATTCAIYGFTSGAYVSMLPIILVDILGIEKLTNAYGLVMFFQGIAYMAAIPVPGFIGVQTGSYAFGFILSGIFVIVSALITCFIPYISKRRNLRYAKTMSRKMPE